MSSVYWLARASIATVGKTPRWLRYSLASTISTASYLGWRSKRLATQHNMANVLGLPASDARVRQAALASWSNYGRTASDLLYFSHTNIDDINARSVDMTEGAGWQDWVKPVIEGGKGAVMVGAHFGSWDVAAAILASKFPVSVLVETFKDPGLNELLQGARRAKNIKLIPMEGSPRRILRDLQENRLVAIAIDRPLSKETGVEVTFFGHKTYVPAGAAAFALKAGAPVLPGYAWYGSNHHYCLRLFPAIWPQPVQGPEERAQEIKRLTQCMYDCLEEVVRSCPTQWFMFRPFWPTDADVPVALVKETVPSQDPIERGNTRHNV